MDLELACQALKVVTENYEVKRLKHIIKQQQQTIDKYKKGNESIDRYYSAAKKYFGYYDLDDEMIGNHRFERSFCEAVGSNLDKCDFCHIYSTGDYVTVSCDYEEDPERNKLCLYATCFDCLKEKQLSYCYYCTAIGKFKPAIGIVIYDSDNDNEDNTPLYETHNTHTPFDIICFICNSKDIKLCNICYGDEYRKKFVDVCPDCSQNIPSYEETHKNCMNKKK